MSLTILAAAAVALVAAFWVLRRSWRGSAGSVEPGDSRQLARLLVAELALYNQEALEELRAGAADPKTRKALRAEILRSREMFEQRAGPEQLEHFDRALLDLLGKADAGGLIGFEA